MYLWFDTESWAKLSRSGRIANIIMIQLLFFLWVSTFVSVILHYEELPIARITESISISIGGLLSYVSLNLFYQNRDQLTWVVEAIDKKITSVPRNTPRYEKYWIGFRKRFIFEGTFIGAFLIGGIALGVPQLFYMLITGNLYYDSSLPLSSVPYTTGWWIQMVYQGGNAIYSGICYSLKEFTSVSIFCYLATLYEVQADTLMELWNENYDPEKERENLIGVIKEVNELLM